METEDTQFEKSTKVLAAKENPYAPECPNRHLWNEGYVKGFTEHKNICENLSTSQAEANENRRKSHDKILRRTILWTEIKAKEQEYQRLQQRINELKESQSDITASMINKMQEAEKISEWLSEQEYESLTKYPDHEK